MRHNDGYYVLVMANIQRLLICLHFMWASTFLLISLWTLPEAGSKESNLHVGKIFFCLDLYNSIYIWKRLCLIQQTLNIYLRWWLYYSWHLHDFCSEKKKKKQKFMFRRYKSYQLYHSIQLTNSSPKLDLPHWKCINNKCRLGWSIH